MAIKWSSKKDDVKIPNYANPGDCGMDIYAYFEEEELLIPSFHNVIIPTGLYCHFPTTLGCIIKERGSTGIKNMEVRAGVIEGTFLGEWKIIIYNGNSKNLVVTKDVEKYKNQLDIIAFDYNKAIAQAVFYVRPEDEIEVIPFEEFLLIETERGESMLGQSGK